MKTLFQKSKQSNRYKEIVFEAGVTESLWSGAFYPTLIAFDKLGVVDINALRNALSSRRAYYLPAGCDPEEIHFHKDKWTFIVLYLFLCHNMFTKHKKVVPDKLYLDKIDERLGRWILSDSSVDRVVSDVMASDFSDPTTKLIGLIIGAIDDVSVVDNEENKQSIKVSYSSTINIDADKDLFNKKEEARKFLTSIIGDNSQSPWITKDENFLYVESPRAFISYAKDNDCDWKKLQNSVKKMRIHLPSEEGLFVKFNGKNCLKYDCRDIETLGV